MASDTERQGESEHQADANRDAERVEADKAKLQSRSDSDASRDLGRADAGRSGAERQAEGDERLRVERETSDEAIDAERSRTDAATTMGRTHHQASAKSSADLLSREQESHRKTQTDLTTREEFLAIVSHDLRNPLNHISMAAQNLLAEPGEVEEVKAIAVSIQRSAGEMLRLIQDLLDIERIAMGKLVLHYAAAVADHLATPSFRFCAQGYLFGSRISLEIPDDFLNDFTNVMLLVVKN